MDAATRRSIALAQRVRDFALAHPTEDAAYAPILARIELAHARTELLATTHAVNITKVRRTSAEQVGVRRTLVRELLRHLSRAADAAKDAGATLSADYPAPRDDTPVVELLLAAQQVVTTIDADTPTLRAHGLAEQLVPTLKTTVAKYQELVAAQAQARAEHTSARAALTAVRREVRAVIRLLDSFNRLRFAPESQEYAEWVRSSTLLGAPRNRTVTPAPGPDASPAK